MSKIDRKKTLIRQEFFTLRGKSRELQLEDWHNVNSSLGLEVHRPSSADGTQSKIPVMLDAVRYDLGNFQFTGVQFDERVFRRAEPRTGKHWQDPWALLYRKRGSLVSQSGHRVMQSSAGSLAFKSYAYSYSGSADNTETLHITLPRENFPKLADRLDRINHTIIEGVIGKLLSQFMLSLESCLPTLTLSEVPVVNESLMALVHSLLTDTPQYSLQDHEVISACLFERARKYIEVNIASPTLSPETVANDLGVSPRQLYYIFEAQGGIAKYIRSLRLAACYRAISDPAELRPIHEIAERFGLGNRTQFSRQFRSQYGHSPSEVREAKLLAYVSRIWAPTTFEEWLGQITRA